MGSNLSENFMYREFACKCGCGFANIDRNLVLGILEPVRTRASQAVGRTVPLTITSGCRCYAYNERLIQRGYKASRTSQHLFAKAADVVPMGIDIDRFWDLVVRMYEAGLLPVLRGLGRYNTFVHFDTRPGDRLVMWDYRS